MSVGILEQLLDEVRALRAEVAELRGDKGPASLTVAEFAKRHAISESQVKKLIRVGALPAMRVGKRSVRIPADAQIGEQIGRGREGREFVGPRRADVVELGLVRARKGGAR